MSKLRAKKIKLILFDVDGVLTDGKIWIFPAPAGSQQSILEQANQHRGEGGFGFQSTSLLKANAHWITPHAGGDGAARDAVEYILKAQGKWRKVVEDYISERGG